MLSGTCLLHEYLSELIDEAADFIVGRVVARATFSDVVRNVQDPVEAMRGLMGAVVPVVIERMTATSGTVAEPRLPETLRAAEEQSAAKQHAEATRRRQAENEERGGRR